MPKKKGTPKPENAESQAAPEVENFGLPSNWAPIEAPPINPNLPSGAPPTPSGANPYGSGPLPPNFGYQPALVKTSYPPSTGPIDLIPIQGAGVAAANAKAIGVSTAIANQAVAGIVNLKAGNGIQIKGGTISATDPTIHGDPIIAIDPGYFSVRDDFSYTGSGNTNIGEANWALINSGTAPSISIFNWGLTHPGVFGFSQGINSANLFSTLTQNSIISSASGSIPSFLWPILDQPGWSGHWDFCWSKSTLSGPNGIVFSMAHTSWYMGFACGTGTSGGGTYNIRPNIFLGIRYDTDPGSGSLALTQVSNPSSGLATYTGTITLGTSNYYAGNMFTVSGFSNAANNGTFLCTASSTTQLTLVNSSSVAQTGATATAIGPAINDSTFVFEYAANPLSSTSVSRNNTQGQTFNTTVTPTENTWYRLDISSKVAGVATLSLSSGGNQLATWTVTASTVALGTTTAGSCAANYGNGWAVLQFPTTYNGTNVCFSPFGIGSKITISGSSVPSNLLGPQTSYGSYSGSDFIDFPIATSFVSSNYNAVATGYPAMQLYMSFGNDSAGGSTSVRQFNLDFIGFEYNPGLVGAAVNTGYSRYFSGT